MFNKTNLIYTTNEQGYVKFFCNPISRIITPFTNPYHIDCDTLGIHDSIDPDVGEEVVYTNIPIGTKFTISRVESGNTTVGVAVGDCDLTWNEQDTYGYMHKVITITNSFPLEIEFEGTKKYKKGGTYALRIIPEFVADRTILYYDENDTFTLTCIKDVTSFGSFHLSHFTEHSQRKEYEIAGFGYKSYNKGAQCIGSCKIYNHIQAVFTDHNGGTN